MEGDTTSQFSPRSPCYFNPLPPHGGRRELECEELCYRAFQSTPSAWRETQNRGRCTAACKVISIHSLRMEGDPCRMSGRSSPPSFQSTPSAWRETARSALPPPASDHFNPLPPHGGRHDVYIATVYAVSISIHSLRMEGDHFDFLAVLFHKAFQSTPSAWRETI